MKRLTQEEVLAGFQLLGLGSEEERYKFTKLAPKLEEDRQEFTRFDIISQSLDENAHAELAQSASRD